MLLAMVESLRDSKYLIILDVFYVASRGKGRVALRATTRGYAKKVFYFTSLAPISITGMYLTVMRQTHSPKSRFTSDFFIHKSLTL